MNVAHLVELLMLPDAQRHDLALALSGYPDGVDVRIEYDNGSPQVVFEKQRPMVSTAKRHMRRKGSRRKKV